MLNLKNTLDGYLKNVEVIGNTIQDANNLADIRSVGDKVEGQELYKIDIVSCGKNLYNPNKAIIGNITENGDFQSVNNQILSDFIKVKSNNYYIHSLQSSDYVVNGFIGYDSNKNFVKFLRTSVDIIDENIKFVRVRFRKTNSNPVTIDDVHIAKPQLEEGRIITAYEPYQEQKLEILSPVQLEKVGDVADRIICKDDVWGIEKNIATRVFDGSGNWVKENADLTNTVLFGFLDALDILLTTSNHELGCLISNQFMTIQASSQGSWGTDKEGISLNTGGRLHIRILKSKLSSYTKVTDFKNWLISNNVLVKYVTTQSQFIPLPHDQQVKLRTFAGQTNISFLTEIPGQIKAQVPKSLGATVNTHTEQIADLHNSLDRVKKLEETTVSTVETESSFTTVDATSNGYFEDVKLEGRTLVNLGGIVKNKSCVKWQKLKSYNATIGKTYTSIIKNTGEVRLDFKNSTLNTLITKVEPNDTISISFVCADSEISVVNSVEGVCGFEWILLEGDHTNNPPEYFKGLMSVGQDVEEVSVESRNRNRLHISENFDWKYGTAPKVVDNVLYGGWAIGYKVYLEKGDYVLSCNRQTTDNSTPNALLVKVKDASTNTVVTSFSLGTLGELLGNFTVSHNSEYIIMLDNQANVPASVISDIQLCRTGVHTEYTQHQYNKKPLLYFNPTTETWEKPVLREWDTIEKHSDGKYYYHKRSKEVVLNGSEDWSEYNTLNHINTFGAMTRFNDVENVTGANCMVDTIPKQPSTQVSMLDEEGLYLRGDSKLCYIKILRSKLSTQDIAGFKAWLKANPTTVVYELLQEEVYECTNIDLMTYSGETNYIINSGAISPKSLLKIHNNISNVVKILQEKVSLLENTFIAGLKSVLSGDMYSLATILYPEDFEQNDNTEQDIMVIPE